MLFACTNTVPRLASLLTKVVGPLPPMTLMVLGEVIGPTIWIEQPWASTAPLRVPPWSRKVPALQRKVPVACDRAAEILVEGEPGAARPEGWRRWRR